MNANGPEVPRAELTIGVFGGSFDPVHCGHVAAARAVRDNLGLDRVLFVVAHDPWKKWGRPISAPKDRLAMVEAALASEDRLEASDLEIRRGGVSYTVDTLRELSVTSRQLFLVVGTDVLDDMDSWDRAEEIPVLSRIAVITRPGAEVPEDALKRWNALVVEAQTPAVSSTMIRGRLAACQSIDGLVPPPVARLIEEKNLYTDR